MSYRVLGGMEVPISGSDSVNWIELSIIHLPLSDTNAAADDDDDDLQQKQQSSSTEDAASCFIIGQPPLVTYLIWRIHKNKPHILELLEFNAFEEFPTLGLRLKFPGALFTFAFICENNEIITSNVDDGKHPYLLYLVTFSGVAYVLKLKHIADYASDVVFPPIDLLPCNLKNHFQSGITITSVAATFGCLVVGRNDGSVGCFQLGLLDENVSGFIHELRDDAGIGRLWGLMARGRTARPVRGLVISEVCGRKLLFALHEDGSLCVWDLLSHTKVFDHTIKDDDWTCKYHLSSIFKEAKFSRVWVGDANPDACLIPLAILYGNAEFDMIIGICSLQYCMWYKKINLRCKRVQSLPVPKHRRVVDLKITSNKLWLLLEDTLVILDTFLNDSTNVRLDKVHQFHLHKKFVADSLFQGSEHSPVDEHSPDDLIWTSLSLFSSIKDQIVPFVSSIFLRRLLQPGVHQNAVLSATIQDFNKHWTESEFQSLTADGLKKELFSLIESEGGSANPISVIECWKKFCTRYFHNWCRNNTPYALLVDTSTGAFGLILQNSISLFRYLAEIEQLIYSCSILGDHIRKGVYLKHNDLDRVILFEVLRGVSMINHQLGKAASAIFYEALVSVPVIPSDDILPHLLEILKTGYSSSVAALHISQLGTDTAWKKGLADHKNQMNFSTDMLKYLHALRSKAGTWGRVLDVIENNLKVLAPRKSVQKLDSQAVLNINMSLLVQSTAYISKLMFESALNMLLLLGYLVNISGQVHLVHDDISRIQLELVPMIQEILTEWLILHFLGTTPSKSPPLEDFSAQLSFLHIDSNTNKKSWNGKLGTCDFTLGSLLFLNFQNSSEGLGHFSSRSFPSPNNFISSVSNFNSWIIWGVTGEESSNFFGRSTKLAMILLSHGQYEAVERYLNLFSIFYFKNLFAIIDAHMRKEKTSHRAQSTNGEWSKHLHLLGFCLLVQAQCGLQGVSKERKVREAIRCFFRASSEFDAPQALQSLSFQGHPALVYSGCASTAAWKLHYYQWAMQIFELYNMSEGACQFALAALEQVDKALSLKDDSSRGDPLNEPLTTIKGRLWTSVFSFTLDLNHYDEAYCAITSNPDEDSKCICLKRFIIVLCERGATKTLCDGQLPFVGLMGKVEQELAWKAERSHIGVIPNPYKLLYAFEMHRHNWRKAATYIYRYSARLRNEVVLEEKQHLSRALQERLNGLSAAINALNLVHPAYAWIDPQLDEHCPNKMAPKIGEENSLPSTGVQCRRPQFCIDIEMLENEFVLTTAQYSLSLINIKMKLLGNQDRPSDLVDLLVQANLYDMAFTVLLKFWKGSGLKREIKRVLVALSLKCCPNKLGSSFIRDDFTHNLLLTVSEGESFISSMNNTNPSVHQSRGINPWEILESYLVKYKKSHPRLPVIVAETLLHTDPQIELPLWLVHMFKCGRKASAWGMTGQEADHASLFRLYVGCGRFTEATNLLLECIEPLASLRPTDISNRKKLCAVWFPYESIERLWCEIEKLRSSGVMIERCDKLKKLLHGALLGHLKSIKVNSEDAVSSAMC
ncbi:hypothetical protein GIB67_021467 [Kingdonia uniflora]|uniref:Nuclear pore complex protein NUP160 domain-containing protein n=1 Tax=Kingdonia uniflora TaxID=39325 RepID=A0A7J7L9D7_9MAGN|nr:hypothetical protein GIB67_021467 [Kingdonia uniflora]